MLLITLLYHKIYIYTTMLIPTVESIDSFCQRCYTCAENELAFIGDEVSDMKMRYIFKHNIGLEYLGYVIETCIKM